MSRTKCLFLITGAALGLGSAALAQSANLDESRSMASELLADASGRTSSLAQPAGRFTVDVHGYLQFRYNWNHRDDSDLEDENTIGFQTARTRLNVSGNIFSEDWYYFIQFGAGPESGSSDDEDDGFSDSGSLFLEDAYGSYKFGNGWEIMWGQFKLPFLREELVSDKFQLAADRSQLNNIFTLGRSQGVQLGFEGQSTRVAFAFSDGGRAANTDFNSSSEADWAGTARVDFKWAGDWRQALDFTSFPQSPFFGMVGGAIHLQGGGDTGNTDDTDIWALTADVAVEGDGWNVFAGAVYANSDPSEGDENTDWGAMIQGGIFVSPQWELFARWDTIFPDGDRDADDNFNTLTLGANSYLIPDSHAAKFTVDLQWFFDSPGNSIAPASTLTGLLPSDDDPQWTVRGQMQLVF